jgi:hypothetical protein
VSDASRLAFFAGHAGKIFVKAADGSGDDTLVAGGIGGMPNDWSADGRFLLYEDTRKLFLQPLSDKAAPIAVGSRSGSSREGRLSPDGRSIAYVSDESGRSEVYLQPMPPATGRVKVSQNGGTLPRWSRGTGELFFVSNGALTVASVAPDRSVGVPQKLFELQGLFGTLDYEVTADGQKFIVTGALRDELPNVPITVVLNWWADLVKQSQQPAQEPAERR